MTDKIFADGLRFEPASDKAPAYIKGKLSINIGKFMAWLQNHRPESDWVNLDIKLSKGGNWYVELNTYKAQPKEKSFTEQLAEPEAYPKPKDVPVVEDDGGINVKDIPF